MRSMAEFLPHAGSIELIITLALCVVFVPLFIAVFNGIPNFLALVKTRYALEQFAKRREKSVRILILVADLAGSAVFAFTMFVAIKTFSWLNLHNLAASGDFRLHFAAYIRRQVDELFVNDMPLQLLLNSYPTLFGITWFGLYAASGFLLKAARRFDVGFEWFNRKFDIEKKPLQSIGLVAGALVAVVYWAAVSLSRAVR
jgi:hypothetical protein